MYNENRAKNSICTLWAEFGKKSRLAYTIFEITKPCISVDFGLDVKPPNSRNI